MLRFAALLIYERGVFMLLKMRQRQRQPDVFFDVHVIFADAVTHKGINSTPLRSPSRTR